MYDLLKRINQTNHKQQGFTLLELLVVFSLTIIITGVGFVSFAQYSQRQKIDQTAQDIKFAYERARFNTVSSVKRGICTSSQTLTGYRVNLTSTTYNVRPICNATQGTAVLDETLPDGVTINGASACSGVIFSTLTNAVSKASGTLPCTMRLEVDGTPVRDLIIQENGTLQIK